MEYPVLNIDSENEHFEVSDSIISWLESHRCKTINAENLDTLRTLLPSPSISHHLSAPGLGWNLVRIFRQKQGYVDDLIPAIEVTSDRLHNCMQIDKNPPSPFSDHTSSPENLDNCLLSNQKKISEAETNVRIRGNEEWAPPRAQIIFNINEESKFRASMQRQNYLCAGCGIKIDFESARRLVLYCHYLGKYFCKCCFSHKAIHLPGYILQKWDFHKYPVSQFALKLLDRIANEPLFNINDINPALYSKVRKLRHLADIRMQLHYIKLYITTCTQTDKLNNEYTSFTHQHLLQDDVHIYSLNNLIEIQHGKLYEYLNDLVSRSIAHIAQCDRCRAKGHYCQLCGPSSLMSSLILCNSDNKSSQTKLRHSHSVGQNISNVSDSTNIAGANINTPNTTATLSINDHELIFPFEIGRVAQCRACGCCFHLQCFLDADRNCPKCERIQRVRAELLLEAATNTDTSPETSITAS